MMLPYLLAAALGASPATPCPSDLLVANPRLKIVHIRGKAVDSNIVSVDVKNQGTAGQRDDVQQHLDLLIDGKPAGSQPIPPLDAGETYPAAFRFQVPHVHPRKPFTVTFHYAQDGKVLPGDNCTTANDSVTAKL